jgi:hypothetical protein
MSFREKSAWVTLLTLIAVSVAFALHLPWPWTLTPEPNPSMFDVLLLAIGAFIAIEIVAHVLFVIWSPKDAKTPKDERELLIELKSTRIGAFAYSILSLVSMFVALHMVRANVIGIAYVLLLSFVVAQIIKYATRIYYYRRGS